MQLYTAIQQVSVVARSLGASKHRRAPSAEHRRVEGWPPLLWPVAAAAI